MYEIGDVVSVEGMGEITEILRGEFWNKNTGQLEKKIIYTVVFEYASGYKGHARIVEDLITPLPTPENRKS